MLLGKTEKYGCWPAPGNASCLIVLLMPLISMPLELLTGNKYTDYKSQKSLSAYLFQQLLKILKQEAKHGIQVTIIFRSKAHIEQPQGHFKIKTTIN